MNPGLHVIVVSEQRVGIIGEVAAMLAESFSRLGVHAEHRTVATGTSDCTASLVVLVGRGPEFDVTLIGLERWRANTTVVLWELDPLPPPGLPRSVAERQLALARARRRWLQAKSGRRARVLPATRKLARRALVLPLRVERYGHFIDRSGLEAGMFMRLEWIISATDAGWIDGVIVTNTDAQDTLAEWGVASRCDPVGAHDWMGSDRAQARDIDVLFLGTLGAHCRRRTERVEHLRRELRRFGIEMTVPPTTVVAEQRAALLNRTKFVVNVRTISWHLEKIRFVLAGCNGAVTITERPITSSSPMEEGVHFLAAEPAELATAVVGAMHDEDARRSMAGEMHRLLDEHLKMVDIAERLRDACPQERTQ